MLKSVLLAVLCSSFSLTTKPAYVQAQLQGVDAEILEGPQNQYILEGTNATITCIANGSDAFWNINGTSLTFIHHQQQAHYEAMGVVFDQNFGTMSIVNLTMIVPACASSAVKNIKCVVRDRAHRQIESGIVNIFVFKTIRPHPPAVMVDIIYDPASVLLKVRVVVTGKPLWNGYEITEYRVNVTDSINGSLLEQITVPNDSNGNNSVSVNVNRSLFESTTQHCHSLIVSASSVSSQYGMSEYTQFHAAMFRAPGTFPDEAIDHLVLFNSDGTLSCVSVQVKLPDVCSYQPVNYTIIVEENVSGDTGEAVEVLQSGPHYHEGPGVVSQDINGLQKDHTYSTKVLVDTVTGSVESNSYLFSTAAEFDSPSYWSNRADVSVYVMAMGISIAVAVVMITAFGILLVCLCVHCQRVKVGGHLRNRVNNSMVPNPIYGGPVYDEVKPRFESSKNSPSPDTLDDDMIDCDEEHLSLMPAESKPLSSNIYTTPGDMMSSKRVLKNNGQGRNKYQLTLSSGGQNLGHGMKVEETYTEMGTTGTLRSQS